MNNILAKQQQLQKAIARKHGTALNTTDGVEYLHLNVGEICRHIKEQEFFMALEVIELMEEIGGSNDVMKPWKHAHKDIIQKPFISTDKIKFEALDMLCFCMNICLAVGITPDNVNQMYDKIFTKNMDRINGNY
jgi:hypothetical protein